jgi:hypothetical protein
MDLAAYRRSAETFVSELTSEYYRHFAGRKDDYEIEPIYDRHAGLFSRGAVDSLRALLGGAAAGSEERRRLLMLVDFAVEGLIGQATKELEAELARREAGLSISVDRETIGFRESAVVQANEADGARREAIEQARLALIDRQLNPLYAELVGRQHELARELDFASYEDLCAECKAVDLTGLGRETAAFTAATEAAYGPAVEPELQRTLGIGFGELRRCDLERLFRAPEQDVLFPASQLVPSLLETVRGLGLEGRDGVSLDVEPRPNKSPRAFCAPVRVPEEVYLVISPIGGRDDFSALFHEAGHTQHYANVDPALPFEFRYLGDNAITEAFAFLFQHLVENPEWLARRLGVQNGAEPASYARAVRLLYLRRYAAKLAYELELHGSGGAALGELSGRYAELLGGALRIPWPRETFLSDVDPGFYCSCYLRAWALETHLRGYLAARFGPAWFESAEAGSVLVSLWREGQRLTPAELLARLTGEELRFEVLLADLGL